MDCSPPGSSIHGIFQARVLERVAIAFSNGNPLWKTIALTRWTFVGKVISLLFNMISRLVTEKAMASHSSIFAWKIPWIEEPGGLESMGLQRVGHD